MEQSTALPKGIRFFSKVTVQNLWESCFPERYKSFGTTTTETAACWRSFPQGGLFGEAFACAHVEALPVSVIALQACTVLLDCKRVLVGCSNACPFHSRLVHNLLQGIAQKNLLLTQKIRCMSQKTIREKRMEFLLEQAKQQAKAEFVIPYDRQALADYLGGGAQRHVSGNQQAEKGRAD